MRGAAPPPACPVALTESVTVPDAASVTYVPTKPFCCNRRAVPPTTVPDERMASAEPVVVVV